MKIAIIGGGITGLSAAYYLQKEILAKNLDAEYHLYEADSRLGGKIQTDYSDGFIIEKGPDSFLARKMSAFRLAKEVGLEGELLYNQTGQAYVLKEETLHPIPGGAVMGIPTKWGPFVKTKLFSPLGKARAAGDLIIPKSGDGSDDQSLGKFFRTRLGDEVVDYLIDPLLSGIYAGNIDNLSLKATFPQFEEIEQKHRSLILGMKSSMAQKEEQPAQGKAKGNFLSFKKGLQSLVDSIENHLDEDVVHKNASITLIKKKESGYEINFKDQSTAYFDRVIITTPLDVVKNMLPEDLHTDDFMEIPSTSVATVAMAFDEEQVKQEFEGTGFVVSKKSNYTITACTWTHKKWSHVAPKGKALLRCYVGRAGEEEIVEKSDEEILEVVLKDLNKIMNVEGRPSFFRITRWRQSMPQYEVGHKQKLKKMRELLDKEMPGIHLAGASYEGLGLPDCITQGEKAVHKVLSSVPEKPMAVSK
ncbi:protoporphyrinogen oxidase [Thalassorhabdus alkalitolerans]|uniref:Coproporphyrinogen III oxidase n=1 Tax=Thalassorhabdus alkalitolerans TaxID=2282697 RepID=A0ABW0YT74_9BACI